MKLQDKSFHKSWINNVQNRENNKANNSSTHKYILKIILFLLILFTIIIILKWWYKVPNVELLDFTQEQNLNQPDTLVKPIILFKNKTSAIIKVEASKAKKDILNSKIIILEKPKGHYQLSNKKDIYFYSTKGILDNSKGILELTENVIIKSSKGTKFVTNKILYSTEKNIIVGEDIINIDGNWGKLRGKGFIYNIESSIISLKGRPILSLNNSKGNIK